MIDDRGYSVSWDDAAGIARTDRFAGAVYGLDEVRAVGAEVRALARGKGLSFVARREVGSIDRSARESFIDQNASYRAVALVVGSPATRMLGNLFLGLKHRVIPVKKLVAEPDVIAWLQRQP